MARHVNSKTAIVLCLFCLGIIPIIGCSAKPNMEIDGTLTDCTYRKTVQGTFWNARIYSLTFDNETKVLVLSDITLEKYILPEGLVIGTHYHLVLVDSQHWQDTWWITEATPAKNGKETA